VTVTNVCASTWAFCDNFETGNGSGWNVKQGPVQNFSVVSDGSKVYRQTDASAGVEYVSQAQAGMAWMDSTVEANLKPVSFSSPSATVTLWGRYDATWNADCGYFVGLRGDGKAVLGKRVAGVETPLGSPVAVSGGISTGTWYDVKLDIQGTSLKAYVNGAQLLTQTDSSCTSGSVGVGSVGASFEADDVRVTAPTTNTCVQNWRDTTTNQCGAFCIFESSPGQQSDRAGCGAYLDCYATHGCSPETCGGQDDVCGVNKPGVNGWGTASKEVADQVYKCLGCAGSVNCANAKYYNGTVCADGNPCTWGDTCQNKVCTPDPNRATQCAAADQCHNAGTCDTTSGKCPNPAKGDGATCDDGNPCTSGDQCANGACTPGQPVTCQAPPNCDPPATCDPANGGCAAPTGCVGSGPRATALFSETWESRSADGWKDSNGNPVVPVTDSTSPAGAWVQAISNNSTTYQPDGWMSLQGGSYCVSAYVRWIGGSWPFIGIQLNSSSGTIETDWLVGEGSYDGQSKFGPVTPISAADAKWQYLSHNVNLPYGTTQVRLVDELWSGATKGGTDLAYFDGLTINPGVCPSTQPETVYQEWWESGDTGWKDGNGKEAPTSSDPSSPAGLTVLAIDGYAGETVPYKSPAVPLESGATICVWSSVRWFSGHEPSVGIQFNNFYSPTLVGGDSSAPVSSTDQGWQSFGENVLVPVAATSAQLVVGVSASNTNTKPGSDLSYFDNIAITYGPCQRPPSLVPEIVPSTGESTDPTTTPGRVDGTFGVTDNGDATYRIPLWVPPGRNGVRPSLALAYSSSAGDGIMGVGWHVEGLSMISRCPKDWARDKQRQAIQFDDQDPLCLDGQRLVLISGNPNRAESEYRLESDASVKIVQVGDEQLDPTNDPNNYTPTGFLVYLPDGTRRSYGNDTSSTKDGFVGSTTAVMEANRATVTASDTDRLNPSVNYDTPARLAWALAYSQDRYGNGIFYGYRTPETVTSGTVTYSIIDTRPSYIAYTTSPVSSGLELGDFTINFGYDENLNPGTRQDIRESFVNGLPLRTAHLLTSITMNRGTSSGEVLRLYNLAYYNDPTQARLKTVQECDGAGICKSKTTFGWTSSDNTFQQFVTSMKDKTDFGDLFPAGTYPSDPGNWGQPRNNNSSFAVGDFNGDGHDDIVYSYVDPTNSKVGYRVRYAESDGSGNFTGFSSNAIDAGSFVKNYQYVDSGETETVDLAGDFARGLRVADLDNDGTADVIRPNVIVERYSNEAAGLGCTLINTEFQTYCVAYCQAGDCSLNLQNREACMQDYCAGDKGMIDPDQVSTGDKLIDTRRPVSPMVGDFDGDGLPDLIKPIQFVNYNGTPFWWFLRNSSSGFGSDGTYLSWETIMEEVNGNESSPSEFDITEPWNTYIADINGDGKIEVIFWDPAMAKKGKQSNRMRAFLSPTSGAVQTSLLSSEKKPGSLRYQFADVNGDGLPDAIEIPINGSDDTPTTGVGFRVWKNNGRDFLPPVEVKPQSADKMGQSLDVLNNNGKPRDPGLRIIDFDGDGRADLLQMGNSCRGVGIGTTPDPVQRTAVTVQTANPDGASFADGVTLSMTNGQGTISLGNQAADLDNVGTTCGGGYLMSQVLDVNGDGLADLVQVEGGQIVVYVRQGQKPGLMNSVTDGLGSQTTVEYRPITDPKVHHPVVAAESPGYPQYYNIRGKWLVKSHTQSSELPSPLKFDHEYWYARADLQGLGYLGMDKHTTTDTTTQAYVTTTYDHSSTTAPLDTFWRNRPTNRSEYYQMSDQRWVWKSTDTSSCTFSTEQDGSRIAVSSCTVDEQEGETIPKGSTGSSGTRKRVRVTTTYDVDHGFVTEKDTSIGTVEKFDDPANELTKLTRSDFTSDSDDTWLVGMARKETVSSYMPGRTDTPTAISSSTTKRTRKYQYDSAKGVVTNIWLEPDSSDTSLYQETQYSRNGYGQTTQISVYDHDRNWRYTAFDYNSGQNGGHTFPGAVRVGGSSTVTGQMAPEEKTTLTYDPDRGLLLQSVDPNGIPSTHQYDTFGRLRTEQRADGSILSRTYDSSNSADPILVYTVDREKEEWQYYNSRGLLERVSGLGDTGARNVSAQLTYDPHGWVLTRTRPYAEGGAAQYSTSYTYDPMGRPSSQTGPFTGALTTWTYVWDTTTRTIVGDKGNQVDTSVVDKAGRVIKRGEKVGAMPTSPTSGTGTSRDLTTWFAYGPFNTLTDVFDPDTKHNQIHADFDLRGRRKTLEDPDTGVWTYTYDTWNDVVGSSGVGGDGTAGTSQTFVFDVLGRKVSEQTSEGTSTFTWDKAVNGIGKLASTTSGPDAVTVNYEYDSQGRMSAETRGIAGGSYRLDFGYDDYGRPASIYYPAQTDSRYSVSYGYNSSSGLLRAITDSFGFPLWHADSRNMDRNVLHETFGDGSVGQYDYEPQRGFLTSDSVLPSGGGTPLMALTFNHDLRGYLSTRQSYLTGETEQFTHDELGRLTYWNGASGGNWSVQYDYDDIGNMKLRTQTNPDGSWHKDEFTSGPDTANNHWGGPHAATTASASDSGDGQGRGGSTHIYNYDVLGRQIQADSRTTTFTDFDLPRTITYSSLNMVWSFAYDAGGQRASKLETLSSGLTSSTIYVGKLYEKRTDTNGAVTHIMYVHGERGSVVVQVTQPDGGTSPTFDYMHNDQLGSVANVTTPSASGSSQMRFDPFGSRIGTTTPPSQASNQLLRVRTGFTGQESEDDLGLVNMNGRLYDPYLARFISADPMITRPWNSQEYNRYSYANNSPFRFTDTTGFQDDGGGGGEGEGEEDPFENYTGGGWGKTATPVSAAKPSSPTPGSEDSGPICIDCEGRKGSVPYGGTISVTYTPKGSATDDQAGWIVYWHEANEGATLQGARARNVGLGNMAVPIRGTILDPLYGPGSNPGTLTMVGAIAAPLVAAAVAVGAEVAIPAAEMAAATHPGVVVFGTGMSAAQGNTIIIGGGTAATLELAREIAAAGEGPVWSRTVGLLETEEGVTLVAQGAADLSAAQKALAESLGLQVAPDLPGIHAEGTLLNGAGQMGLTPTFGVVTNNVCSGVCAPMIEEMGGWSWGRFFGFGGLR
jgi:RHS repeat-associated protein